MSSVGDGYLNLRYRPRFEPPLSQRVDRDLIEKRIAGAFRHGCTGNVAARGIDGHNANAAASNMGTPRFVWIIRKRGADRQTFCGRQ